MKLSMQEGGGGIGIEVMAAAARNGVIRMAWHLRTQEPYRIIAEGRDYADPSRKVVIYEQLYDSVLRDVPGESGTRLPRGTVWVRDRADFCAKFREYAIS